MFPDKFLCYRKKSGSIAKNGPWRVLKKEKSHPDDYDYLDYSYSDPDLEEMKDYMSEPYSDLEEEHFYDYMDRLSSDPVDYKSYDYLYVL